MRVLAILLALSAGLIAATSQPPEWPQWRGPFNTGMAARRCAAPAGTTPRSLRWKLAIPGRGHSTPVVAGNRLFLTTAVPTGQGTRPSAPGRAGGGADAGLEHRFEVIAVDRRTGTIAWQRTATVATPHEGYHRVYGSFASNSPVTDGTRVFAFFGSRGLYAYDLDGTLLWQKDFGVQDADGHGVRRGHAADAARRPAAAALRPSRHRLPRDARSRPPAARSGAPSAPSRTTGPRPTWHATTAGVRSS